MACHIFVVQIAFDCTFYERTLFQILVESCGEDFVRWVLRQVIGFQIDSAYHPPVSPCNLQADLQLIELTSLGMI
jgi:hypothetical protein